MKKEIAIQDIRVDEAIQYRPVDDDIVLRYVTLIEDGAIFPPVEIVFDGKNYWMWDGHRRLEAYRKIGRDHIPANVEEGTKPDAIRLSISTNSPHRTPRPKYTAKKILFEKIFPVAEFRWLTDETVGGWVGVTASHVSGCRREYEAQFKGANNE